MITRIFLQRTITCILLLFQPLALAQVRNFDNVELIVCAYADAIKADASMFPAYSNLIKELVDHPNSPSTIPLPGRTEQCLLEVGLLDPGDAFGEGERLMVTNTLPKMLERVEARFGASPMLEYNRLAVYWNFPFAFDEYIGNMEERLLDVLSRDPSIPGAHSILGIINAEKPDFPAAVSHFDAAAQLQPRDPRFLFNLGQASVLNGRRSEAKQIFELSLQLNETMWDSHLSLAVLALWQRDLAEADRQLQSIPADAAGILQLLSTTDYLRAHLEFRRGNYEAALSLLESGMQKREDNNSNTWEGYWPEMTAALLEEILGREGEWRQLWRTMENRGLSNASMDGNEPQAQAWLNLSVACSLGTPPSQWVNPKNCLPADLLARTETLFSTLHTPVFERFYFRDLAFTAGMACPFLYSWDPAAGQWVFDTTIITNLSGRDSKAEQRQPLTYFNGQVMIREVEEEISYLDRLAVEAVDSAGRVHVFHPDATYPELSDEDDKVLVLERGDEIIINFMGYDPEASYVEFRVVATGYYEPLLLSLAK